MSFFDPIVSGISSLLDPLTSGLGSDPTSAPTMGNTQSTTTNNPATSALSAATSVHVQPTTAQSSPNTVIASTTSARATISPSSVIVPSPATSDTSSATQSTTLATSTRSSSSSSTFESTTAAPSASGSSSTTFPAPAQTSAPPSDSSPSGTTISTAGIIVAILFAVALVASILWLTCRFCPPVRRRIDAWSAKRRHARSYREAIDGPSPPEKDDDVSLKSIVARERSLDGEKISLGLASSSSAAGSSGHERGRSLEAAEKLGIAKRPFSFAKINTSGHGRPGYSWKVEGAGSGNEGGRLGTPTGMQRHRGMTGAMQREVEQGRGPVHYQTLSPDSAGPETRGNGLGLGSVSVLRSQNLSQGPFPIQGQGHGHSQSRNHAWEQSRSQTGLQAQKHVRTESQGLLRAAGYDVPAASAPSGPSMTATQAELARPQPTLNPRGEPVKRKPLPGNAASVAAVQTPQPASLPLQQPANRTPRTRARFSYEADIGPEPVIISTARLVDVRSSSRSRSQSQSRSRSASRSRGSPRLRLGVEGQSPVEKPVVVETSQIGLAVSGSGEPGSPRTEGVGVAR